MTAKPKCYACKEPADHVGTIYRHDPKAKGDFLDQLVPEEHPMCETHALENNFGLWPHHCTKACVRKRTKLSTVLGLKPKDFTVWLQLEVLLGTEGDNFVRPKCPWCGKAMKPGVAV